MIGMGVTISSQGMKDLGRAAIRLPPLMGKAVKRTAQGTASHIQRLAKQQYREGIGSNIKVAVAETVIQINDILRGYVVMGRGVASAAKRANRLRHEHHLTAPDLLLRWQFASYARQQAKAGDVVSVSTQSSSQLAERVRIEAKPVDVETAAVGGGAIVAAELVRRSSDSWGAVAGASDLLSRLFPDGIPIPSQIESRKSGEGIEYYVNGDRYHIAWAFKLPKAGESFKDAQTMLSARQVVTRDGGKLIHFNLLKEYLKQAVRQGLTRDQPQTATRRIAPQISMGKQATKLIERWLRSQLLQSVDVALNIGN